jgi:anti-sigma factor (TIGR02949 family)
MKSSGEMGCREALEYMDSYLSDELLVETCYEVVRHLEGCSACSAELAARTLVRTSLRHAIARESVPADLRARIHAGIQRRESRGKFASLRWAVALAAGVVLCAVAWLAYRPLRFPALSDRAGQEDYIHRVSAPIAAALRLGLGDHLHCSVFRHYSPEPAERMEKQLGTVYQGLLPLLRAAIPGNYNIVMGHQCRYAGRRYVHLSLQKEGKLMSLIITLKQSGESLDGVQELMRPAGIPVYEAAAERYRVAAFETERYFAFVVSDLNEGTNLQMAVRLAPSIRGFLEKVKA